MDAGRFWILVPRGRFRRLSVRRAVLVAEVLCLFGALLVAGPSFATHYWG
jgi:hypothetical protein